jgi:uncharacterized protein YacL
VCKTKVEKNEGCNHMTCIICKYEFCWFCLGYAGHDANHWSPVSPYYCGASQFGNVNSQWQILNYLKIFLFWLAGVLLIPALYVLYFVLGGLIAGAAVLYDKCGRSYIMGAFGTVIGLVLGVLCGALLSPFALFIYLLGILGSICFALYFFFMKLKLSIMRRFGSRDSVVGAEERTARENAMQRIQDKIKENKKLVDV